MSAEPAPSLFWDLIRGIRPTWWARSANSGLVGALLTSREWLDELESSGFVKVTGRPVLGEESIGVSASRHRCSLVTTADGGQLETGQLILGGETRPLIAVR